jgi:hypothetical protein
MLWLVYYLPQIQINQQGETMHIYADVKIGKVSDHLYTLLTLTKAKKFRAGFTKKDGSYRVGTFDLKNRETWKQQDGTMYKRKGKARTTNPDEYILAHDLVKKQPRNISVNRLKWFSVGKKVYKINHLAEDSNVRIFEFEKVKFNYVKDLLSANENTINQILQGI